jgi:hypothetical protein
MGPMRNISRKNRYDLGNHGMLPWLLEVARHRSQRGRLVPKSHSGREGHGQKRLAELAVQTLISPDMHLNVLAKVRLVRVQALYLSALKCPVSGFIGIVRHLRSFVALWKTDTPSSFDTH